MTIKNTQDEISLIHDYGINVSNRSIYLKTDPDSAGIDGETLLSFIKNLGVLEAKSKDPIIIHQYCLGGEWGVGMGLYDAIINSPCKFIYICHGYAASMGSVMPQAVYGKGFRVIAKHCSFMIHEGTVSIDGTNKSALSTIESNNYVTQIMYNIYTDVCITGNFFKDYKRNHIKTYLKRKLNSKEDWWINASEAVDYGFMDGILGEEGFTIPELIKKLKK